MMYTINWRHKARSSARSLGMSFRKRVRIRSTPHATTTAYGRQPIVNPIVDGRIFFRGGNGIYCYDLRKK